MTRQQRFTKRGVDARRSARFKVLLVAALVTLGACGDESPVGPSDTNNPPPPSASDPVAGAFTLTTVNALALPFTMFNDGGYVLQLTSSTMLLETGGQFILAVNTRETVAGFPSNFADTVRGTWTQNVGAVTLTRQGGASATAVWNGTTLAFPYEGESGTLALIYTKNP